MKKARHTKTIIVAISGTILVLFLIAIKLTTSVLEIERFENKYHSENGAANSRNTEIRSSTQLAPLREELQGALVEKDFYARTLSVRRILSEWSRIDAQDAARRIVALEPKFRDYDAVEGVARILARKDPLSAFAFAGQIDDYRMAEFIRRVALKVWAESNPLDAAKYVLANFPAEQQGHALDVFARDWGAAEPRSAMALALTIPDLTTREYVLSRVLDGYSYINPSGAAKSWNDLTGLSNRAALAETIARNWSAQDPIAATAWAQSMPESDESRPATLSFGIAEWSRSDPQRASQVLSDLPRGFSKDSAIIAFVNGVADSDPAAATHWASRIDREEMRRSAYQKIAESYANRPPQEAQRWLDSVGDLPTLWLDDFTRRINKEGSSQSQR